MHSSWGQVGISLTTEQYHRTYIFVANHFDRVMMALTTYMDEISVLALSVAIIQIFLLSLLAIGTTTHQPEV